MIGCYNGVSTLLKEQFPRLQTIHCMAHRLELAVKNAADTVNAVGHFKIFVDSLYKFYSMSPKNQRDLREIAANMDVVLLKIGKIFEVRWAFSSFLSLKALLKDYAPLHAHFLKVSALTTRSVDITSNCKGLVLKMSKWAFVAQLCMLKDALRTLKHLSLFFQSVNASLISAGSKIEQIEQAKFEQAKSKIEQAKSCLLAMKDLPGKSLNKMISSFEETKSFRGVILNKSPTDSSQFDSLKRQFFQSLHDNLVERFPCTDIMNAAKVLDPREWPNDIVERTLFGDREVAQLCKLLCFQSTEIVDVLSDFYLYKSTNKIGKYEMLIAFQSRYDL